MDAPKSEIAKKILSTPGTSKSFWEAIKNNNIPIRLNGQSVTIKRLSGYVANPKDKKSHTPD